ncbi:GH21962, partial [Drosophila grimshawi]
AKMAFFKRANGWRPFLYDFSVDICKFLENPQHIIARLAFEIIKPYTNVNHSCPYHVRQMVYFHKSNNIYF